MATVKTGFAARVFVIGAAVFFGLMLLAGLIGGRSSPPPQSSSPAPERRLATPADRADFARKSSEQLASFQRILGIALKQAAEGPDVETFEVMRRAEAIFTASMLTYPPEVLRDDPAASALAKAVRDAAGSLGIAMKSGQAYLDGRKPSDGAAFKRRIEAGQEAMQRGHKLLESWAAAPAG